MTFEAIDSTADQRISRGRVYSGQLLYVYPTDPGLRVCVYDNKKEWTTFKPSLFKPFTVVINSMVGINEHK